MDAEAELLKYPPFGLDHGVLEGDVVGVQHDGNDGLTRPNLLNVPEDVDDVARAPRRLFDLAGESEGGHGDHVERIPDERLGEEEPVEEDAARRHRNL